MKGSGSVMTRSYLLWGYLTWSKCDDANELTISGTPLTHFLLQYFDHNLTKPHEFCITCCSQYTFSGQYNVDGFRKFRI